jgi:hypothetical protein
MRFDMRPVPCAMRHPAGMHRAGDIANGGIMIRHRGRMIGLGVARRRLIFGNGSTRRIDRLSQGRHGE